jgi:hypothetical protein
LDSRGETPPEPAGEDARATILPGEAKNGVKMRPLNCPDAFPVVLRAVILQDVPSSL